jgi:predicted CXXCH cytochrome family protein
MTSRYWGIAAAAVLLAACSGQKGTEGPPGNDAAEYVPLEQNGVVGRVTDAGGAAVPGGTVYFVRASDVADMDPTTITSLSDNDEPLEDTIRRFGDTYTKVTVGTDGVYRLSSLPAGSYYVTYMPATADYLPGGSLCRVARSSSALVNTRLDIEVSASIPSSAEYVGSSACIRCHLNHLGISGTMHRLGIWSPYSAGPLQDLDARRTDLYEAFADKFDPVGGTTVYFFGYDGTRKFDKYQTMESNPLDADWVVSTTYEKGAIVANSEDRVYEAQNAGTSLDPEPTGTGTSADGGGINWKYIPGVTATVNLYKSGSDYRMLMTDYDDLTTVDRKVDAVYGGGVNKQRYLTKITYDDKFYYVTLPLQFNPAGSDANADRTSRVWRDYHLDWWFDYGADQFRTAVPGGSTGPARGNSFEKQCMSCHAMGVQIDKTDGLYKANTVKDPWFGDFDYDGDGIKEELNIGCETCHGPGSAHMAVGGYGKHIVSLKNLTPEREAVVCGQCHSRPKGRFDTDSPVNADGWMMRAGTSRQDYLQTFVGGASGAGQVDAATGDLWGDGGINASGIDHSKAHHQQYTDFIRSKLYKNANQLMTCSICHDPHQKTDFGRQLKKDPNVNAELCGQCHATDAASLIVHIEAKLPISGTDHVTTAGVKCVDCHMPKTAQTGAASPTITGSTSGARYQSNDVTSHVFDAPRKSVSVPKKMPTAYVSPCGTCHEDTDTYNNGL